MVGQKSEVGSRKSEVGSIMNRGLGRLQGGHLFPPLETYLLPITYYLLPITSSHTFFRLLNSLNPALNRKSVT